MARDHFVYWQAGGERPRRDQVQAVIEDFFGPAMIKWVWDQDRFVVMLVGKWSHPLLRIAEGETKQRLERERPDPDDLDRYLEVWLGEDSLDVITRRRDDFTNVCAEGLTRVLARGWGGRVDIG